MFVIILLGTNMVSTGVKELEIAGRGSWYPRKSTGKFKLNADNYAYSMAV